MVKPNQPAKIEVLENFEDYDPRDDQILELSGAVSELAEENRLLREGIMARIKPDPEDGTISFGEVVKALETENRNLREHNRVLTISRDGYMNDVSERQRAAIYWRSRAKKLEKQLEGVQKNA
jgi:hypothetical protein